MSYFDSLKEQLRLNPVARDEFLREIQGHVEDRACEFQQAGLSRKKAKERAIRLLGSPKLLARQVYAVYNQGSWRQAMFCALPHFIIAALFALQWWHHTFMLAMAVLVIIASVLFGWLRGKPNWLFPWLGYILLPVIAGGVLLLYLPSRWSWFAALAYLPLVILIVVFTTRQALKRDWMFVTLMLLPFPIAVGWMLPVANGAEFTLFDQLGAYEPWIALSFAAMALGVTVFVRARSRWVKGVVLIIIQIIVLLAMAIAGNSSLGLWGWSLLFLFALSLFVIPALLEKWVRRSA